MEPFALFNLLQSLIAKNDGNSAAETVQEPPIEQPQPSESPNANTPSENAASRFLDEHERRARRFRK